ncbi:ABC transporter ATP-binding protein [Pseudooceanicola sp. C21-150M6]|uniref:ABC transporter ATP-binding protein n=1 Tax=Pseudooceanicola sp. C21-150M6 TaxID=3434355 RepID=UPI003D7FA3F7
MTDPTLDHVLNIRDLSVHFPVGGGFMGRGKKILKAVEGFDLRVRRGETLGVVGESGCGKSTLARALMGLVPIKDGHIGFHPRTSEIGPGGLDLAAASRAEWKKAHRAMQIVFQDPFSSLSPKQTVGQTVGEPLIVHGVAPRGWRERVGELLDMVGLSAADFDRYPHEFSGGQRQRIMIARAIALEPEVLIADEAVSALDVSIQLQVIRLLEDLKAKLGLTLIFISHDLSVVRALSDRVVIMYLGRPVEVGEGHQIFSDPRHPYTRMLIRSTPVPDPDFRLEQMESFGELPSPIAPPPGCPFHTRCAHATDICKTTLPGPVRLSDTHHAACHFATELPAMPPLRRSVA